MANLKKELIESLIDKKDKWKERKAKIYFYGDLNNFNPKKFFYETFYNQFLFSVITYISFASGLVKADTNYSLNQIKDIKNYLPFLKKVIVNEKIIPVWEWKEEEIYTVMSHFFKLEFEYELCEKVAIKVTELSEKFLSSSLKTENEVKIQAQKTVALLLYLICSRLIEDKRPIYSISE